MQKNILTGKSIFLFWLFVDKQFEFFYVLFERTKNTKKEQKTLKLIHRHLKIDLIKILDKSNVYLFFKS